MGQQTNLIYRAMHPSHIQQCSTQNEWCTVGFGTGASWDPWIPSIHQDNSYINVMEKCKFYLYFFKQCRTYVAKSVRRTVTSKDKSTMLSPNLSPPSAAYLRRWAESPLFHVTPCRLLGESEPVLKYWQLDH